MNEQNNKENPNELILNLFNLYYLEEYYSELLCLYETYNYNQLLPLVCMSLYYKNYNTKFKELIEKNPKLLEFYEIQKAFHKIQSKPQKNISSRNERILKFKTIEPENLKHISLKNCSPLNKKSTILTLKCLTSKNKKEELTKSILLDNRNLKSLLYLIEYCVMDFDEILDFIHNNITNRELAEIYKNIFKRVEEVENLHYSTKMIEMQCMRHYNSNNKNLLFKSSMQCINQFPESEVGFLYFGFYYLNSRDLINARKMFFYSYTMNRQNHRAIMGLGHAYSKLKDGSSAIDCFNRAQNMIPESYLPLYYLALEYLRSGQTKKAEVYTKKALDKKMNDQLLYLLGVILIKTNNIQSLKEIYQNCKKSEKFLLLKLFDEIFNKNYFEAEKYLNLYFNGPNKSTEDHVVIQYNAIYGFLSHSKGEFEKALDCYSEINKSLDNDIAGSFDVLIKHARKGMSAKTVWTYLDFLEDFVFRLEVYEASLM